MVDPAEKLHIYLADSAFPFSKRMMNFFKSAELSTVMELTHIPLEKFTCFRGFKEKCKRELIAFIEFEEIQTLFPGFDKWVNEKM